MKIVKYRFLSAEINVGTEKDPKIQPLFVDKELRIHSQAQYEIALPFIEKEAYEGQYTVEEIPDTDETLSQEDRIAELEEALELILSGATQ